MISQTTEYALRAMVVLGKAPGRAVKTKEIAKLTKVPPDYLSKILQNLCRTDLVKSQRGAHGGISIGRPASEITLLDIVNAVDPIVRIRKCPLNLKSHGLNLCALHKKLDHAISLVETVFQTTTLAQLLDQSEKKSDYYAPCDRLLVNS